MKFSLAQTVLAFLALMAVCGAVDPLANLHQHGIGNIGAQLDQAGNFQGAINIANNYYRGNGRLTAAFSFRERPNVEQQLTAMLTHPASHFVVFGRHGGADGDLLFGTSYPVEWNAGEGLTNHVVIFRVRENTGIRVIGFAFWEHGGSHNDVQAFVYEARLRGLAVPLTTVLEHIGYPRL